MCNCVCVCVCMCVCVCVCVPKKRREVTFVWMLSAHFSDQILYTHNGSTFALKAFLLHEVMVCTVASDKRYLRSFVVAATSFFFYLIMLGNG